MKCIISFINRLILLFTNMNDIGILKQKEQKDSTIDP